MTFIWTDKWLSLRRVFRPGWLTGPIFDKELRVASRRRRLYTLRVLYILALTVFAGVVWLSKVQYQGDAAFVQSRMAEAGKQIVTTIVLFQFCVMQILAIIMLSSAISDEVYHRTLGMLMTTPDHQPSDRHGQAPEPAAAVDPAAGDLPADAGDRARPGRRALGLSAVGPVHHADGLPLRRLGQSAAVDQEPLRLWRDPADDVRAGLSLFPSAGTARIFRRTASEDSRLCLDAFFGGLVGVGPHRCQSQSLLQHAGGHRADALSRADGWCFPCRCTAASCWAFPPWSLPGRRSSSAGWLCGRPLGFRIDKLRIADSTPAADPQSAIINPQSGTIRRVVGPPVVWKELRAPFIQGIDNRNSYIGLAVAIVALVLTYLAGAKTNSLDGEFTHVAYVMLFVFIGGLVTIIFSATRITTEKESQSWPLLLTTPLSDWDILLGKAVSAFRRCLPIWGLLAGHVILFTLAGYIHPVVSFHLFAAGRLADVLPHRSGPLFQRPLRAHDVRRRGHVRPGCRSVGRRADPGRPDGGHGRKERSVRHVHVDPSGGPDPDDCGGGRGLAECPAALGLARLPHRGSCPTTAAKRWPGRRDVHSGGRRGGLHPGRVVLLLACQMLPAAEDLRMSVPCEGRRAALY